MKYKIITVADINYFEFVKAMVKSATVNFPDASIYVELINMDKEHVNAINSISNKCSGHILNVKFENNNQRKCFCTNRRVDLFYKIRNECDDILVWIDADSLVRKPCDELMDIISKYDVSAVRRPAIKPGGERTLRAGIIALNNTHGGYMFLERYVNIMKKHNQWNNVKDTDDIHKDPFTWKVWMANQNVLDQLIRKDIEMKELISFGDLSNKFCDVHLSDDGVIWAAKNKLKKSNIYIDELEKYNH